MQMEIHVDNKNEVKIFSLKGRLDSNTSPQLEEKIASLIETGARKMIINFKDLEYISSAGLRVILKTTKDLKRNDGRILLCAMQDYVREVFEIAGFDTFLPIVPSIDEALREL
jgi:anti-sigma B factor antagonist